MASPRALFPLDLVGLMLFAAGCGEAGSAVGDATVFETSSDKDTELFDQPLPAIDRGAEAAAPLDRHPGFDGATEAPRDAWAREDLGRVDDRSSLDVMRDDRGFDAGGPADAALDAPALDRALVRDTGDGAREAWPGGWRAATYVFSAATMVANDRADDRVEIGWIETDATRPAVTACGESGPWVRRSFYRWSHNGYPRGDCTQDVIRGVAFRRWDHVNVRVDDCPGAGNWFRNGAPTSESFLRNCPAHVPAGFGQSLERIIWTGRYTHDPVSRRLVFHYDTPEGCRREFYRDLSLDPGGALLAMTLDGAQTRDREGPNRGIGNTRGYAYGSSSAMQVVVPFRETMAALADPNRTFLEDAWHLREADSAPGAEPDHDQANDPLGLRPQICREGVAFDHSCGNQPGEQPYLRACAAAAAPRTANLRFLIDAFAPRRTREMLFWEWFAHHAGDWSGCYHNGSHARPVLQVVDARGQFRGLVGVEIQRSQRTVASGGGYVADPDGYLNTDYRVFRWIERGFQETTQP